MSTLDPVTHFAQLDAVLGEIEERLNELQGEPKNMRFIQHIQLLCDQGWKLSLELQQHYGIIPDQKKRDQG